ncbi:MAG TPA: hypothetical protein VHW44_10440 [Pseudonocardiaceae bacterium]|jgi:hypothetical protein|nr:hypothetical protein [Pseudonocardiaceae bacterium]
MTGPFPDHDRRRQGWDREPWGKLPGGQTADTGPIPDQSEFIEPDFTDPGYQPPQYRPVDNFPSTPYQGLGTTPPETPPPPPAAAPFPPPRRGRGRRVAIVAAVVVLAVAGTAVWWFTGGPGHRQPATAAPAPTTTQQPRPSAPTTPGGAGGDSVAYDVGTCFDEQAGDGPGHVELAPVSCAGQRSVFVINKVVPTAADCDSDPSVSFKEHGYEVPDETANVAYCASLVVPPDQCFLLSDSKPIQRSTCGSDPAAVEVLEVQPAPNVGAACTNQQNPDIWFYQAPTSGQYACVSRPTSGDASGSTPTSTPTGSSGPPSG